jgi:hypothetical protein
MRIDVLTPDGPLLRHRTPTEQQLLQALAVVEPSRRRTLSGALQRTAGRPGRAAVLVVITPGLNRDELRALAARARGAAAGAIVLVDAASFDRTASRRPGAAAAIAELGLLALPVLRLRAGDSFKHVWHSGVHGVALAR